MNAKFFDLKKEKQDRMINAAVKIFALNGYTHASTDEIVKEAHISKGLLFHYFESKIGVYTFIYDYMIKYYALELSSAVDTSEKNYFKIMKQIESGKLQALKAYPYMKLFLDVCDKETVAEAIEAVSESKEQYKANLATIMGRADKSAFHNNNDDSERMLAMLDNTIAAVMESNLRTDDFSLEKIYSEDVAYIDLVERIFA